MTSKIEMQKEIDQCRILSSIKSRNKVKAVG